MHKDKTADAERRRLDSQLDLELEATFPASDPPKITLSARNFATFDIEAEQHTERR